MILRIAFVIVELICAGCIITAIKSERRNWGFIFTTTLVIIIDMINMAILGCKGVGDAKIVFTAFYVSQAWLFAGVAWTLAAMGRHARRRLAILPLCVTGAIQSLLIFANALGSRQISFSKHILLGQSWWIAEAAKNSSFFLGLGMYNTLAFVCSVYIGCLIAYFSVQSAKIFRPRFYILLVLQVLFVAFEAVSLKNTWPVWMASLLLNLICVVGLYFINFYSRDKLRNWSLLNFANEMSDGFILYDEHDDLIHMNDLIKNTLPEELLKSFADKNKLDEWVSHTELVNNMEILVCENDSSVIYFSVRKNEIKEQDIILGTIFILHDATEGIQKMRAMEEANRELERAAKMKSDFLANMSHEIRTPMNAVIGMAEIALREELPVSVVDYLNQIKNSGHNLLNIINDILDFSKIEAGKMEIFPEKYEPMSELNDIANVLATRIQGKNLELFMTVDPGIPCSLVGDIMRIRQVLINLANNAIKFTKEGIVHIQISGIQTSEEEVALTFDVIDTGQGIKQEDLDKLFVSFQQVDSKRNRTVEGTGLGLAISERLCTAMGGSIGVQSVYGKGSDFYFTIPQKVADPTPGLIVENAKEKFVFFLNEKLDMIEMFLEELSKLGVEGKSIQSPAEYVPTGKKDYAFFELEHYDEEIRAFLDQNPECVGIVLVDFDSDFLPQQENLRVMRRPETTLNLVHVLNDQEMQRLPSEDSAAFKIDFTAPEAKILIVDDNAINITIAEGLLRPLQAQCDSALSGEDAIAKVKRNTYDIILMDHMMPEMDGMETTDKIRKEIPSAANTPIIALTANVMEGVRDMFIKGGMNDFVGKPVDIKELITKVRQWLPPEKIQEGENSEEGAGEEIVEYEGLDSRNAIKAIGMVSLYQKIVEEYYRQGAVKYQDIQKDYDGEDWADYSIKVHTLKSSSRQIGALALGDMAEKLEAASKELALDVVHEGHGKMMDAYQNLLDTLSKYFEEDNAAADRPLISQEELDGILQGLKDACEELDMDGMEAAENALKEYSYPEEMQEDIERLRLAIGSMDTDTCDEIIEKFSS
ncbi:MAG: response regulator [Lachnospiraceae bacterium]|nr:response regulator [Lachnospiraceae bacterium]